MANLLTLPVNGNSLASNKEENDLVIDGPIPPSLDEDSIRNDEE